MRLVILVPAARDSFHAYIVKLDWPDIFNMSVAKEHIETPRMPALVYVSASASLAVWHSTGTQRLAKGSNHNFSLCSLFMLGCFVCFASQV
jgi:hypothetical protein